MIVLILPAYCCKFIRPSQPNRDRLKMEDSLKNQSIARGNEESILRSMKKFENYSRARFWWHSRQDSKSKYQATKDSFFKQLARYPKPELEILKANIESKLELGKYFICFGLLIAWLSDRSFNENSNLTTLTAAIVVSMAVVIYQILATQVTRLYWLKIAIARKGNI